MQLYKIINVLEVQDLTSEPHVEYEMALIRVSADSATRGEIMQLVDIYRASIVDVDIHSVIIRIVAKEDRVDALLRLLEQFGIVEMVRTGRVAMVRGSAKSSEKNGMVMAGNGHPI
jgi:acetolactate synthase-1/3 small subunit